MKNTVIVTGAAGFIGSHVCEKLKSQGWRTVGIDNFEPYYDPKIKMENISAFFRCEDHQFYFSDIRDKASMEKIFEKEKPQAVIHLAAKAGVRPSLEDPVGYTETNVRGTQIILECCRRAGIRSLVFASSSSVYGNTNRIPFSEDDPIGKPISPYAATKHAGELLCHVYAHCHAMRIAALRFFTAYGPRQRPDLAIHKFTKAILNDETIPFYGDGMTGRDYTYINDIVDGVVKALEWTLREPAQAFEVFNLGSGRVITLNDMIYTLEKMLGQKARIEVLPLPAGDVLKTWADVSKAKKTLDWNPSISFEEGIRCFVHWLNMQKNAKPVPGLGISANPNPFFSVVMPVYNGERYIEEAVGSVRSQTFLDWELVIVDDASTDGTPAILEKLRQEDPRIRVFRNEVNCHIAESSNRGIREARGQWMIHLDADDLFKPEYLDVLRSKIGAEVPKDVLISSWAIVVDQEGKDVLDIRLPSEKKITSMMRYENFLYHSATSFSKALWEKAGGYPRATKQVAEDTGLWLRMFNAGAKLQMIAEPLVQYRVHGSNVTTLRDSLALAGNEAAQKKLRQSHEWFVSLFLKQCMPERARQELKLMKERNLKTSLKNLQYYLMTFAPRPAVNFVMWELRPRLRAQIRLARK